MFFHLEIIGFLYPRHSSQASETLANLLPFLPPAVTQVAVRLGLLTRRCRLVSIEELICLVTTTRGLKRPLRREPSLRGINDPGPLRARDERCFTSCPPLSGETRMQTCHLSIPGSATGIARSARLATRRSSRSSSPEWHFHAHSRVHESYLRPGDRLTLGRTEVTVHFLRGAIEAEVNEPPETLAGSRSHTLELP